MSTTLCLLKAEQFFGAKLRRRPRAVLLRGLKASRRSLFGVVLQIFPLLRVFTFLLSTDRPTARARMFLICSRSFSLSRPGLAVFRPLAPQQESKVEKRILVATLIFSSREKPVRSLHGCRRRRRPWFC